MFRILKYIVRYNPWYAIPYRLLLAFGYQLYKRLIHRTFVKCLFNGKQMAIFPFSPNASAFMYTAIPDKTEMMLLRSLADDETVFLDVGANIGEYCMMTADVLKECYAFEAHPKTAQLCKINFLLNGLDEQRVIVKAISDQEDTLYFSDLPQGSPVNQCVSSSEGGIAVPATTLDAFVDTLDLPYQPKFLLKIDVEGHEMAVLRGAKKLLTEYPVKGIILERFSDDFPEITALLKDWGYQIKPISTNNVLCQPAPIQTQILVDQQESQPDGLYC